VTVFFTISLVSGLNYYILSCLNNISYPGFAIYSFDINLLIFRVIYFCSGHIKWSVFNPTDDVTELSYSALHTVTGDSRIKLVVGTRFSSRHCINTLRRYRQCFFDQC